MSDRHMRPTGPAAGGNAACGSPAAGSTQARSSAHMGAATRRAPQGRPGGKAGRRPGRPGRGGKPNKGNSTLKIVIVSVLVLIAVVVAGRYVVGRFADPHQDVVAGAQVSLDIKEGQGPKAVAQSLYDRKLIESKSSFLEALKAAGKTDAIKAGSYVFTTGQSVQSIVDAICTGSNSSKYTLTVPEGLTVRQLARKVEAKFGIASADFLKAAKASRFSEKYPFLKEAHEDSLEGFLFPKTYTFKPENLSSDTIISAMLDQYRNDVAGLDFKAASERIRRRYGITFNQYDFLIMASIIEKEAYYPSERVKVASVFYNRLKAGMPLQSDATMMYVTGGAVSASDLKKESPYNSYLNKGLTPTPICSPGLDNIKAAMNPADTDYLYFLILEQKDYSKHVFSKTYEEHQKAIEEAKAHI